MIQIVFSCHSSSPCGLEEQPLQSSLPVVFFTVPATLLEIDPNSLDQANTREVELDPQTPDGIYNTPS